MKLLMILAGREYHEAESEERMRRGEGSSHRRAARYNPLNRVI